METIVVMVATRVWVEQVIPSHRPPGTFDLALSALYYLGGIGCIKSATLDQENSRGPARPLLEVSGGRDAALDGD